MTRISKSATTRTARKAIKTNKNNNTKQQASRKQKTS